jgi:WD40 repeat protein
MKKSFRIILVCVGITFLFACVGIPSEVKSVETANIIRTILQTGHSRRITDIAFSGDGKIAATAAYDGKILVWRVSDGLTTHTLGQTECSYEVFRRHTIFRRPISGCWRRGYSDL